MNKQQKLEVNPDYGLDAPTVVRNLLICGAIGLLLWISTEINLLPGDLLIGPVSDIEIHFPLGVMGLWSGIGFLSMGFWMIWSSRIGKIKEREKLLDYIEWSGNENVLDIGCGQGLMVIGAAKRLTTGKATGIDKWNTKDLSGNRPEGTIKNAVLENVADRVDVKTADMRQLPFGNSTFDVILSCSAIHNLNSREERANAIAEIVRVLKPGGRALIDDIRNQPEYKSAFKSCGCSEIRRVDSIIFSLLLSLITFGTLSPGTLLIRKSL